MAERKRGGETIRRDVSLDDQREVRKFIRFLGRVRDNGGDAMQAYAEEYGEVVFYDADAAHAAGQEKTDE